MGIHIKWNQDQNFFSLVGSKCSIKEGPTEIKPDMGRASVFLFLFFPILWCYYSSLYVAKFSNIQNMKVENLKHPFIFLAIVLTFGDFWRFQNFPFLTTSFKTRNLWQNIRFQFYFFNCKMVKIHHRKNYRAAELLLRNGQQRFWTTGQENTSNSIQLTTN